MSYPQLNFKKMAPQGNSDGLPREWRCVLRDICDAINGHAFKQFEWINKGITIIRIQNLKNSKANFNSFQEQ